MTSSAAIVGGGIGGLATAKYLTRHGWHVDVFERAEGLPDTGTALGMWPEALTALDAIGAGDAVRSIGSKQRGGEFRRARGRAAAPRLPASRRREDGTVTSETVRVCRAAQRALSPL